MQNLYRIDQWKTLKSPERQHTIHGYWFTSEEAEKRRVWNLKPRHLSFHVKTNANGLCHKNPIRVSKLPSPYLPDLWPFSVLFVCLLVWSVDLLVIKPVLVVKKTEDKEWANLISAFLVGVLWKVNVWRMRAEVIDYPIRSALSKPYHDGVQAILWCSLILQFK